MGHLLFNHTFFHIATTTPNWEPYDANDKTFPHQVHHCPIAVSLLRLTQGEDEEKVTVTITSKCIEDIEKEERRLVNAFFQKVPGETSSLVSFNGRSFTLPVMVYRALRHGVDASNYLQEQEVFTARLSSQHTDVADFLSGHGTLYKHATLSEYAQMIGLAKRPYLDVAKAFSNGDVESIVDRLEVDVLLMATIYFRILLSQGRLSIEAYRNVANLTLKTYRDRNKMAMQYLNESNVKRYLAAGHPTKKKIK